MISIYKTIDGKMTKLDTVEDGCWINLIYPSEDELKTVSVILGVELPFLKAALDEEETSRIDSEDGQTLIIVDTPAMERDETGVVYSTLPMGIIVTEKHIVTVCLKETSVVRDLQDGLVKDVRTQQRTRFILNILLLVAKRYLQYLKQIDKTYNYMERQLYKSQRNKELIQLLDLEKSLVYFNTSLKANEVTLEKILRGRIVTLYEEDQRHHEGAHLHHHPHDGAQYHFRLLRYEHHRRPAPGPVLVGASADERGHHCGAGHHPEEEGPVLMNNEK